MSNNCLIGQNKIVVQILAQMHLHSSEPNIFHEKQDWTMFYTAIISLFFNLILNGVCNSYVLLIKLETLFIIKICIFNVLSISEKLTKLNNRK